MKPLEILETLIESDRKRIKKEAMQIDKVPYEDPQHMGDEPDAPGNQVVVDKDSNRVKVEKELLLGKDGEDDETGTNESRLREAARLLQANGYTIHNAMRWA